MDAYHITLFLLSSMKQVISDWVGENMATSHILGFGAAT